MWFKLVNANFTTNLGTMSSLSNSWGVTWSVSGGIIKTSCPGSVTKGGTLNATLTLNSGASLTSITSSSGTLTKTVSGTTVTVTVTGISANCTITVVATGGTTGGTTTPGTTTWYQNATSDGTATLSANSGGTGPYYYHNNANYVGKAINAFRAQSKNGSSTIKYGITDGSTFTNIGTFTISAAGTYEIATVPEFTVPSGKYIWFTGEFNYSQDQPDSAFWFCDKGGSENKMNLGIDLGYVTSGSSSGGNSTPTSTTWYLEAVDGFTLNATCSANGSEKYYYQLNTNYVNKPINAIKLNAVTAGTFEYGVKNGETYTAKGTATASSTGVVTINVSEFTITGNQLFYILTKTGAFKFGTTDPSDSNLYFNGSNGSNNKMNLGISLGYVV